ncbi:TPA: glycosyltransferase family 4 protein [Klebsiella aerogenes]|nr:glycosyltransferase family 4 protein [Klebsiella aerogenes]
MIYVNGRFLTQKLTGVQRFAYEMSLRLSKLRHDVVVLVPDMSAIDKSYNISSFSIKEIKGGRGHFWEQFTLPLFLKKQKDCVLVNLCNSGPLFFKRQIVTQHDITYIRYPESFSFGFRLLYSLFTPVLLKNSKLIVTVSDFSKSELLNYYNCDASKIHIIPNAVSNVFFKPDDSMVRVNEICESDYFLTVSSVNHHKNIHGLIETVLSADLNINLKIIGDRNTVFNCVNIKTDDPRIDFLGRVPDEELIALYRGAKAFIFPSYYEGFGIPPLEAQSCSCPVISSNRASLKETLGDSVLYFDPDSKYELIKAIIKLNNNADERNLLIDKGKSNVERYSWERSAEKLNILIAKIY